MKRKHPYIKAFETVLEEFGVTNYQFSDTRKHAVLQFEFKETVQKIFFPQSPSDFRGPQKAGSFLRRTLKAIQ